MWVNLTIYQSSNLIIELFSCDFNKKSYKKHFRSEAVKLSVKLLPVLKFYHKFTFGNKKFENISLTLKSSLNIRQR